MCPTLAIQIEENGNAQFASADTDQSGFLDPDE